MITVKMRNVTHKRVNASSKVNDTELVICQENIIK